MKLIIYNIFKYKLVSNILKNEISLRYLRFWINIIILFIYQQFNKVYMEENATPLLKGFNLFMLVFAGKLVYRAVTYSEYLSM